MKKLSVFAVFSMICGVCLGAPSLRASSVPVAHQNNVAPAGNDSSSNTQGAVATNTTSPHISLYSPLSKFNNKFHPNTTNTISNTVLTPDSVTTANTAKEMVKLQEQIDELLTKQERMEDSLSRTVQAEIANSELTTAISNLQEKTTNIEQFNATVDNKISDKLVETGLVDRSTGNLKVATKDEIKPEILAGKLDDTFATVDTVNDLAAKSITTENITNNTVKEALSDAGFATKNELPKINEETVSAALQGSKTIDNAVVAKLKDKNILDENESLKVATKAEISADALESKLSAKFVKPTEISADALETTLESKFAKKGEVGTDETAVKRLIVSDLKERGIVSNDDNPKLQVATKDEHS